MKLKTLSNFLNENTLFDPGQFEEELKEAISKAPSGSIYVEKQLSLGTLPHMKMIAKRLGLHVVSMSAQSIDDAGRSLARFLIDPPVAKTLVIFDEMERAEEKTISFIEDLIESRLVLKQKVSPLYYFAEIHLIDRILQNWSNDDQGVTYGTNDSHTQLRTKDTDSTS